MPIRSRGTEFLFCSKLGKPNPIAVFPLRGSQEYFLAGSLCGRSRNRRRPGAYIVDMLFFAALILSFWMPQTDALFLNGVVLNSNAQPVADVHVHLEEPTARRQWDMNTNRDGAFRFERLAFGTYRLTI